MRPAVAVGACALLIVAASGCHPGSHPSAPVTITVTEADAGRTIALHPGQLLVLRLHSTYWNLARPSDPTVLSIQIAPAVSAPPPGRGGCVPGGGCGTVTVTYRAIAQGVSAVSATRVSCGEALRCTPAEATYRLMVHVTP